MAKYSNVVEYNIITDVDTSGITKLQNELVKLKQSLKFDKDSFSTLGFDNNKIEKSIQKVNQLQNALTAAFNPKIGTLDLSKFNNSLQKEHTNLQMIVKDWESMGARGNMAISSLSNALLSMNKGAVTVNTTLSKIANTFSNTVRWGITASIFQEMMSSIQGAVSYMKDLDESLTQIQMVTGSSKENMRELAQYANNAAQALGSTTTDYTNAVKVFVQEGFSESESKQYANLSTKLANVSEQNTATTSDQITAFRNAFQLDYEQTVAAMDKVANVANNTASNVNELMTASQRAASVAQAVGSSQDSFLAAIATIESVTRQSAEEIGNGLKTIYQRFADIKVSGKTEDGVDYGQYAKALKQIGVDVLDAQGEFKGMDQILKETQEVWSSLSDTMKVAVGEKVAGKFQYNRFAALMNNQDYYEKALAATGESSEGMMDQMNEFYTESIEGRLKTLQAAGEQVMSTLFNQDDVEPVIETLTNVVNAINDIVDAAGGLQGVLPVVGGLLMRTFSTELAGSITNIASSIQMILANSRNAKNFSVAVDLVGLRGATKESPLNAQLTAGVADNYSSLSESTREKLRDLSQQILELEEERKNVLAEQETIITDIYEQAVEEQRLAREELESEKQKLGLNEEEYQVEKDEIRILESREKINGNLSTKEREQLEILRNRVALFEKESTEYDEIVQKCSIYNEKLLRGEKISEEELKDIKGWRNELNNLGINVTSLDNLIMKIEQLDKVTENTEKTVQNILNTTALEARLNNITRAIGGLSSAFMGIHMLGEMFKTLSDETATAEEKFTAFTMNGLMGITMLLPVVIDFVKAIAAAKEGSLAFAAAERIRAAASAMANGALLLNPVVLGIMAAIAVAALAIAAAHEAIFGAVDKANRKFEEQKEILDQTKKSYQELDEKVEDITSKMESISDAKQSLSEMAKGTEEWKNKVEELNDQIYELLEAYPELIEFVKSENGVLSIDEEDEDYKAYITDLKNQKLQARQSSLLQQGNVKKAENNAQWESFKLKYGDNSLTLDDISNKTIDELKKSIDDSRKDYPEVISALSNLKRTIDTNNIYVDNINSTISGSLGYTNYAGTKVSNYENPDLSQYQITKEVNTSSSKTDPITGTSKTTYDKTKVTEWDANNEILQKAIKQQYANLKDITEITSKNTQLNPQGISFKYTNEENKLEEKTISKAEVEAALSTYLQSSQYIADSFTENAKIFKMFGATVEQETQEFKNSEGKVITSLNELGSVSEEQAAIMNKMVDQTYHDYMTELYGSVEEFAGMVASGQYANSSEFADREAGYTAFTESQRLEGLYGDQYQSIIESFKSELDKQGSAGQDILSKYNSFETMEDFTRAVKDGTISLDGLSEALDKIKSEEVDLTHNINGNEFTNRVDISSDEEKFKDFLEDSGMTEGAFSRMSRDAYEEKGGYYQVNKENLEKDIENQEKFIATLKDSDEALEKEQQKLAGMRSELEDLDDAAKDSTAMILRMSNGVVKLRNNIDDISEVLTNDAFRGTTEWYEALDDLDKGLSEVLNIDAGTLSDTFLESGEALDYARRMAEGDMSAIDDLRAAAAQDIVKNISIQVKEGEDVDTIRTQLLNELNQLQNEINSGAITVTTDVDNTDFIKKLNEMLKESQISAEQASNILSSMGMDAKIDYIEDNNGSMPAVKYKSSIVWEGVIPHIEMIPEYHEVKGVPVKFPVIRGAHYTGPAVQTANTAARNPSYTGGYSNNPKTSSNKSPSSSGSNKNKNNQKKEKETSEWDYLTDITNDLDRAAAAMEKLTKLEDRLFGANRVSQLKKLQSEYKNYIKLLQQEVKIAQRHAETLRTQAYDENGNLTMNGYAYRAGVGQLQFDAQGNLDNGRQIEQALLKRMNDAIDEYNEHRNDEDTGQYEWNVNQTKSDYDGFMKAMSEYESTLGKIEDSQSAIQDYKEKIQDAADSIIDAIQENLDNVIDAINDRRDFNRTYRNWQEGGNSYSHFNNDRNYYIEGLQGLLSSRENSESVFDLQLNSLKDRIKDAENIFDNDSNNADDEKLSEQAAFENLKESTKSIMETLNQMIDYYDSILETVQEASDKMDELIDSRLKSFDNIEKRLGTRLDQIKLLFGDKSYEKQAQIYQQEVATNMAKLETIADAIKVKQATVDSLEKLEEKNKELSTEERQALQDAREKITELQEEQLDTETKTLQAIRNQKETAITAEVNNMVQEMFNGADIDWLSQQWELASRNSEKYLDDYNRAFEIQKLELKFQEALNDNQHASLITQQKINDLANEYLTYLREKEHLSDYDVKHAQMQLDILQKQIALEDARNNKSQMRLQRNAAGNYDFVYGANEDEVNKATEALLQAQQDSYNLSKQMYLDTYEAAFEAAMKVRDMVVEVAMDASLNTEQQVERIHYILENLNEYMQGSSVELGEIGINLYNSFVEASQAVAEINQGALSDIFDQMEQRAIAVQETVNSTTEAINGQFNLFGENANGQITTIYDNIISTVGQIQDGIIGEDGTLNKIKVGTDTTLIELSNDIILPVLNTIDDRFNLTGENAILNVEEIETAIQIASINITGTTTKNLDDIDKSAKETLIGIFKYVEDTNKNIEVILNNDVVRVQNNGEIVKDVYDEVDEHLKEKFENSSGYLQQFQEDTEDACSAAEDNFDTFTEDAVKEANRELKNVRGETQNWRTDLDKLNKIIDNGRIAMDKWKTKIDEAWGRADNFTSKSFNLQERLANIGGLAAYSADRFEDIRDIAPEAGSAVNTMENEISGGYEALQTSAENAMTAVDNLKDAIGYLQDAANNLDFSGIPAAAQEAVDEAYRIVDEAANSSGSVSVSVAYDNPWNWAYDEYGQGIYVPYGYDTGGYTGKWSDKGISASDNGKLAILHQKELVLNESDTENMLSTVELVRDIMSNINQLPSIGKNIGQNTFSDNIEQRVEISATFPGVTEAIEIKQALEQIANNAYQVANRYKY